MRLLRPAGRCRLCGNPDLIPVCDLGRMAFTGVFPAAAGERVPDGPLELVACHGDAARVCGLVQLRHAFDPRALFGPGYGYRSGLNGAMAAHLHDVAMKAERFAPLRPGDVIMDIGSNDGTLLRCFSGRGFSLFGVDPAAAHFSRYYPADVQMFPEFFPGPGLQAGLKGRKARIITAIAVFYDLADPLEAMGCARDMLADDGVLVLEQGYWPLALGGNVYDMICHEHVAYYGARQIKWLADRSGLRVIHAGLNPINGGSLCVVLGKQDVFRAGTEDIFLQLVSREEACWSGRPAAYGAFRDSILCHRDAFRDKVRGLRAGGAVVAGYGASTKGNVLLQFCGFTPSDIAFMAEINRDKWGRVCPGTGIPIIPEEEARGRAPDVFVVLPWHLKDALVARERAYLARGGTMLFPWPRIHAVEGV